MITQDFLETWNEQVREIPQLSGYDEVGYGASYPVFVRTQVGLCTRHFYYRADQTGPDTMVITEPCAVVLVKLDDFSLVSIDPANVPWIDPVSITLSPEERKTRRALYERLSVLYDQIVKGYPAAPDSAVAAEFVQTLQKLVPPVFWPYYEALLDDFFAWAAH